MSTENKTMGAYRTRFRSLTRRSSERGTAMMEALMVNIVLVVLLAGVVFFQATYSAKIKSDQNSRAYAWTYALHGCVEVPEEEEIAVEKDFGEPNGGVDPENDDTKGELDESGDPVPSTGTSLDNDPTYTENVFGTGQGASGAKVGTVNATSSVQMASFNMLKVQGSVMTSTTHVQCNPTPANEINVGNTVLQSARNLANW